MTTIKSLIKKLNCTEEEMRSFIYTLTEHYSTVYPGGKEKKIQFSLNSNAEDLAGEYVYVCDRNDVDYGLCISGNIHDDDSVKIFEQKFLNWRKK